MKFKSILNHVFIMTLLIPVSNIVFAGDVELNPGYIEGTITLPGFPFTHVTVTSEAGIDGELNAITSVSSDPASESASYSTTVQVEVGQTFSYGVSSLVSVGSTRTRFSKTYVDVNEAATSLLDINLSPAYITGKVVLPDGISMSHIAGNIYAIPKQVDSAPDGIMVYLREYGPTYLVGEEGLTYRIPIAANTKFYGTMWVYFTDLPAISFTIKSDGIAEGDTQHDNFIVEPSNGSNLTGTINYSGSAPVRGYWLYANGPSSIGKFFPTLDGTNITELSLPELVKTEGVEQYTFGARAILNYESGLHSNDDAVWLPRSAFSPSYKMPITDPEVELNISTQQSYLNGRVNISGAATSDDLKDDLSYGSSRISFTGPDLSTSVDKFFQGGQFDIIGFEGTWYPSQLQMNFLRPIEHPSGPVNGSITVNNSLQSNLFTGTELIAGETSNRDIDVDLGSITVNFSVSTGQTLSNPTLKVNTPRCYQYDESGTRSRSFYLSFKNTDVDVVNSSVTMLGINGHCEQVEAVATVTNLDGTNSVTTFGKLNLNVIANVDQEIDIGGPTITVDVEPNSIVEIAELLVTGTATDDVEVTSVIINGVQATLVSTNNPDDLNEVSFSALVTLVDGTNSLITIATDSSGKQGSDTRTVILENIDQDSTPPTLIVALDDQTYVTTELLTVSGISTDDVEVSSVTINGVDASLSAVNDTADANDMSFSSTVTLTTGSNEITTTATDSSGNQTTVIRTVIFDDIDPVVSFTPADGTTIFDVTTVTVEGTATDDSGITSLLINGQPTILTEDGNESYSFSAEVSLLQCGLLLCDTNITVKATDGSGRNTTETHTITMETNLAPDVGTITVIPDVVSVGDSVTASANFEDPNTADSHTAIWSWGDGTNCNTATDQECSVGGSSLSATHSYTSPGMYTVTVTITDEKGISDTTSYQHVIVFDENDGFVTGGGWMDASAGKAHFGFVAKYKKGATTPTGNAEFQLQASNINFHTNTFQWLVISDAHATFSGVGTLNGETGYTIEISVVDARLSTITDVDMIKVKIIEQSTANIIYDSEQVLPISSGSIVVHNKSK